MSLIDFFNSKIKKIVYIFYYDLLIRRLFNKREEKKIFFLKETF